MTRRYPFLRYDATYEALFDPEAGVLYADKCVRAMQSEFARLGGTLLDECHVTAVRLGVR